MSIGLPLSEKATFIRELTDANGSYPDSNEVNSQCFKVSGTFFGTRFYKSFGLIIPSSISRPFLQ